MNEGAAGLLKIKHTTNLSRDTLVCGHCFEKETLAQLRTLAITWPQGFNATKKNHLVAAQVYGDVRHGPRNQNYRRGHLGSRWQAT